MNACFNCLLIQIEVLSFLRVTRKFQSIQRHLYLYEDHVFHQMTDETLAIAMLNLLMMALSWALALLTRASILIAKMTYINRKIFSASAKKVSRISFSCLDPFSLKDDAFSYMDRVEKNMT